MKVTSRFTCRSRTKSLEEVGKMTKNVAYVGMLVVVAGLLLTTCASDVNAYQVLSNRELMAVTGTHNDMYCSDELWCTPAK